MTDEELTKKIVKVICDLKKSKIIFHKISNKVSGLTACNSPEEEYTVIGVNELGTLRQIKREYFEIGELARKMYQYLKSEDESGGSKGRDN